MLIPLSKRTQDILYLSEKHQPVDTIKQAYHRWQEKIQKNLQIHYGPEWETRLKNAIEMEEKMLVKDVMKTQLVTLNADSKLGFANDIMYLGRIRHLPVVKDDTVVGILTQRDLYRASLTSILTNWKENKEFLDSIKVSEVMTKNVITVTPDATIEEAAQIMIDKKVGGLPVVKEKNKLVGLITETDVLQYFVDNSRKKT